MALNFKDFFRDVRRALRQVFRVLLGRGGGETPLPPPPPPPPPPPNPPPPPPPPPPAATPRVMVDGERMTAGGKRFILRDTTGFALCYLLATQQHKRAEQWIADRAAEGFNCIRVLTTAVYLFDLDPKDGRMHLGTALALARRHGMYLRVVAIADSAPRDYDWRFHASEVMRICMEHSNAIFEFANEPYHDSQAEALHDPAVVQQEAMRTAAGKGVVWTAGAAWLDELTEDGEVPLPWGQAVTRHLSRSRDGLNMARRVKELAEIQWELGRPVWSGEPIGAAEASVPGRREADPNIHYLLGVYAALFNIGSCFHSEAGLRCDPFGPVQQACAAAFLQGTRLIPDEQWGEWEYRNSGDAGATTTNPDADPAFEDPHGGPIIRAYTFVRNERALTVVTHRPQAFPEGVLSWSRGWQRVQILVSRPHVTIIESVDAEEELMASLVSPRTPEIGAAAAGFGIEFLTGMTDPDCDSRLWARLTRSAGSQHTRVLMLDPWANGLSQATVLYRGQSRPGAMYPGYQPWLRWPDGGFDLSIFDERYFDRMHQFITAFHQTGQHVVLSLLDRLTWSQNTDLVSGVPDRNLQPLRYNVNEVRWGDPDSRTYHQLPDWVLTNLIEKLLWTIGKSNRGVTIEVGNQWPDASSHDRVASALRHAGWQGRIQAHRAQSTPSLYAEMEIGVKSDSLLISDQCDDRGRNYVLTDFGRPSVPEGFRYFASLYDSLDAKVRAGQVEPSSFGFGSGRGYTPADIGLVIETCQDALDRGFFVSYEPQEVALSRFMRGRLDLLALDTNITRMITAPQRSMAL